MEYAAIVKFVCLVFFFTKPKAHGRACTVHARQCCDKTSASFTRLFQTMGNYGQINTVYLHQHDHLYRSGIALE